MTRATTTKEQLDDAIIEARRALDAFETLAREPCGSAAAAAAKTLNEAAMRIAELRDVHCAGVARGKKPHAIHAK